MSHANEMIKSRFMARKVAPPPGWYRTPKVQTLALGFVFFLVFTAYTTIQFYAASTYGPKLASNSVGAVYLSFTLSCLVAPAVTNKIGCRNAMSLGILGYASLVVCSLVYFLHGGDVGGWTAQLVVVGGAVLGFGAALLWTAQGRLILQYASIATEGNHSDDANHSQKFDLDVEITAENGTAGHGRAGSLAAANDNQTGTLMGLFWAVFQCSSLVGGSISFAYYSKPRPTGSVQLYVIFLGFILCGAIATQFLLPPSVLIRRINPGEEEAGDDEVPARSMRGAKRPVSDQTPLLPAKEKAPLEINEPPDHSEAATGDETSDDSWYKEATHTLNIFFTKRMLILSVLFFYTGYNQPYQQATFGNRFFAKRTIGLELIVFHLMEIVGGLYCGWALDKKMTTHEPAMKGDPSRDDRHATIDRRKSAVSCLAVFVAINLIGNTLAFHQEYCALEDGTVDAVDIQSIHSLLPTLAFACWGFADSQIQVYCYWLLGGLNESGTDHSRSVAFYKCVQSLGVSLGFYLIPTSRLNAWVQLVVSNCVFVLGTALSLLELPPTPSTKQK